MIVAHRISTITSCDLILYLEKSGAVGGGAVLVELSIADTASPFTCCIESDERKLGVLFIGIV